MSTSSNSYTEFDVSIRKSERPYRDPEILQELYHERGLNLRECAEELDTSARTVLRWMKKCGLRRRGQHTPGAAYNHNPTAHPMWVVGDGEGSTTTVYVAQLTVIAEGADPAEVFSENNHVHHRNNIPFDNRGENLEVLTVPQHNKTHSQNDWEYSEDLGCHVLRTVEKCE